MTTKLDDTDLLLLVMGQMNFPRGVNDQITDAVAQTLNRVITDSEVWEQLHIRHQEFKKRGQ
jgi:hypothetical protein